MQAQFGNKNLFTELPQKLNLTVLRIQPQKSRHCEGGTTEAISPCEEWNPGEKIASL